MNPQWIFENLADPSPSHSSVHTSPLFTPPTNLQHQDVIHGHELYYPQEGFDYVPQPGSSQFSYLPFQPRPSHLAQYVGYERESFETLPPYAREDQISDMLASASGSNAVANLQPSDPPPTYEVPTLPARSQDANASAPQLRRRHIDASAYDHYFQAEHQRKQRNVLDLCLRSDWLAYNWPEPLYGKQSIFCQFLSLRSSPKEPMRCLFDGCTLKFDRVDRAVGHLRTHIAHQPFTCTGGCSSRKCYKRFSSPANLHSHLTRRTQACGCCGKQILPQNMRRHLKRHS